MGGGGKLSAFGVFFGGRVLTFLDKFKNFTNNEVAFVFLSHLFFNNFVSKYYDQVHQLIKLNSFLNLLVILNNSFFFMGLWRKKQRKTVLFK